MSDILIKNMKMPENCVGCPLAKNYGMCAITKKTFNWGNPNRLSDCPLIEVLPHGRLIDADAMNEKFGDWYTEEGTEEGFIGTLKYLIAEQPTIIEADGET